MRNWSLIDKNYHTSSFQIAWINKRETVTETETERARETERETERDRERQRETDRERAFSTLWVSILRYCIFLSCIGKERSRSRNPSKFNL